MLAISTAFNSKTKPDAKQMLLEIKEFGFNAIEISHHFTSGRLEELITWSNALAIKIVSIHNYCPLPAKPRIDRGTSDYYRLSSLDEDERKKAVEYTKGTIDTAQRLSVEVVVIHAGTVELSKDYGGEMIELYVSGKRNSRAFSELRREFIKEREDKKLPHLEAVAKSLEEILDYASKAKVKIGLETRYYPREIPNFEEIGYFLKLFGGKGLFYWHDTGHAEASERLGFTPHVKFLKEFSERMIGMHLHDIKGLKDHLVPFTEELDYSKIAPYLTNDLIKVIEVNSQAMAGELEVALARWEILTRGNRKCTTIEN